MLHIIRTGIGLPFEWYVTGVASILTLGEMVGNHLITRILISLCTEGVPRQNQADPGSPGRRVRGRGWGMGV